MHSALKPEDPVNLSHLTGVRARSLDVENLIFMLKLDQICPLCPYS